MAPTPPLDLSSLSHYQRSITIPTSSRNAVVAKLLTRYHGSSKHSEQAAVCLQLANHYFTSELFRHALPYYAASMSHSVQCTAQHDLFPLLTLLRRLGECHHQLQHHSAATVAFHTALALLAAQCSGSAMTRRHWTYKQEVLLSLGNSYQDWCDAEEERGFTAGRPLALHAKDAHYESLLVARRLCGMDGGGGKEAGGAEAAVEDAVREKAMTNKQATVLARAYINLANTLTQLLHFENVEREACKRVAAASAHIDSTDSSCSSSTSQLDDSSHESGLASTLSSLSSLSLTTSSSSVSLSSLAASLYASALSLALSHSLVDEEQRVYSNRSTLYEEDGQWAVAEEDIRRELKLSRKRKHKGGEAAVEQAACKARLMTLAVRAGRYEQAVREARERRRMVAEARVADEEEVERAEDEVELMEEIKEGVRQRQAAQRLLEAAEAESDDDDERASKRQRIDWQSAGDSAAGEANRSETRVRKHIALLHRYVDVCLSLAERNVDCHANYAAALASHQHAISLLASVPPHSPAAFTSSLTLSVHSYHLYTITRYLPWLLPQQHSPDEVRRWTATARAALDLCRPLATGADRGLLALLECHLMEESGAECEALLSVLRAATEEAERGGDGGVVVRGQLLREQWHVLALMDEEDEHDAAHGQPKRKAAGSGDAETDREAEVRQARRARRKVQRTLLKGQMEVAQRWVARNVEEADRQRAHIKSGLWLLGDEQSKAENQTMLVADNNYSSESDSMDE